MEDLRTSPRRSPRAQRSPPGPALSLRNNNVPLKRDSGKKRKKQQLNASVPPPPVEFDSVLYIHEKLQKRKKQSLFDGSRKNLTEREAHLWSQPVAASNAAKHHAPGNAVRLLGVITRNLKAQSTLQLQKSAKRRKVEKPEKIVARPPTKQQCLARVKAEAMQAGQMLPDQKALVQAQILQNDWRDALQNGAYIPKWNTNGELPEEENEDFISCNRLLKLLEQKKLIDLHQNEKCNLYGGMMIVRTDTKMVLKSLLELANTDALYHQPLVVARCSLRKSQDNYVLQIGVYLHRLGLEVMTTRHLQIVMAALDHSSYLVSQPLVLPPMRPENDAVFVSDPTQVLVYNEEAVEDALLHGSTRDQSRVDAFSIPGFLKLMENHGSVISSWPDISSKILPSLQIELMLHQIHGVCWMVQMESLPGFGINSMLWEEREFADGGKFFYSPATGQARLTLTPDGSPPRVMRGGILADEMGLGKTVQVLSLIIATLEELKQEAATRNKNSNDGHYAHATLIVVPPALEWQWLQEIEKITGDALVYDVFGWQTLEFHRKSKKTQGMADIVVTTYKAFEKKKGHGRSAAKILNSTCWGRVVLDEMQEIRSSTNAIAKNCEGLECDRRWMLSGTPLFDGPDDLKGELCFLRLAPFAASSEDGFFQFAIENHWEARSKYGLEILKMMKLFILRRTKSMTIRESGLPLLGLKPLTVTFEPVPQSPSERALYCFMEYLVHASIHATGNHEDHTKNKAFLRILREMCVSLTLLNGGYGCQSEIPFLNRLMVERNRAIQSQNGPQQQAASVVQSPDEAIMYLSQVEEKGRVDEGFVTSLTVGGGGGVSRRNRAHDSPEEQHKQARERMEYATRACEIARSKRAVAFWHRALEGVTTGRLPREEYEGINSTVLGIWQERAKLSPALTRGWRPSEGFFQTPRSKIAKLRWQRAFRKITNGELSLSWSKDISFSANRIRTIWRLRSQFRKRLPELPRPPKKPYPTHSKWISCSLNHSSRRDLNLKWFFSKRPEFLWAYPFSAMLEGIPSSIREKEIAQAFIGSLEGLCSYANGPSIYSTPRVRVFRIAGPSESGSWKAFVLLENHRDFKFVMNKVKTVDGIKIKGGEHLPWIEKEIALAKAELVDAIDSSKVYPCDANRQKERNARKAYQRALRGLSITTKDRHRHGHVLCRQALGALRTVIPKSSESLFASTEETVVAATAKIATSVIEKAREERNIKRLEVVMLNKGISQKVATTTAFETLTTLKNGEPEKTQCPVCLDVLGSGENSNGHVSVTRCGHIFCKGCLDDYLDTKPEDCPPCIACRKGLVRTQIIEVDPKRTVDQEVFEARRKDAKSLVHEASKLLDRSNGQLVPHLWEALYLAIDLPPAADQSAHGTFTAIPSRVLAHLRHATGMPIHNARHTKCSDSVQLSSKIRALLDDLPRNEPSVVFASSKESILHLKAVLEMKGIGCRCLYTGESEVDLEDAVSDWQSTDSIQVLAVQAGAAACGLTLTSASKMFLLEPFLKYEEEQQAYARLHRYGQEKEVKCKVYFTPVSIESRLLEWRKHASGTVANSDKNTIYAPMRLEEAPKEEQEIVEQNQTRFLLGINEGDEDMDSDSYE